jgi:hypothetical protein
MSGFDLRQAHVAPASRSGERDAAAAIAIRETFGFDDTKPRRLVLTALRIGQRVKRPARGTVSRSSPARQVTQTYRVAAISPDSDRVRGASSFHPEAQLRTRNHERYQESSRRPPEADFVMQDLRSLTYSAGTFLHAVGRPRLPGTCSIKPFFLNSTKVSFI